MTLRGLYLHLDNVSVHNAKRSPHELVRTKSTKAVHPVYSPDTAPSNFFFGHLKREMDGFTASSPEDALSLIRRIFEASQRKPSPLSTKTAPQDWSGQPNTRERMITLIKRNPLTFQ
jgi:hypothetical protein